MKSIRHAKIRDIIENNVIETQEDLAEALRQHHIEVTQATVSRDIKEMMLIKVPIGDGRYRYAYPKETEPDVSKSRLVRMFRDSVTKIDQSVNIVVIHTLPGMANAVAWGIDHSKETEIIGTIAGDDTIVAIVKPEDKTERICERLRGFLA